eukprot:8347840-Alexandrium_andersonii.AAC.1
MCPARCAPALQESHLRVREEHARAARHHTHLCADSCALIRGPMCRLLGAFVALLMSRAGSSPRRTRAAACQRARHSQAPLPTAHAPSPTAECDARPDPTDVSAPRN